MPSEEPPAALERSGSQSGFAKEERKQIQALAAERKAKPSSDTGDWRTHPFGADLGWGG